MKKHNIEQAVEIFKQMFEGLVVVTKQGQKFHIEGVDTNGEWIGVYGNGGYYLGNEISHIEQTKPMNGDEVWAWDDVDEVRDKYIYIGKSPSGHHICVQGEILFTKSELDNVELISHIRKLTIQEATEIIRNREKVEEPFEIIKD